MRKNRPETPDGRYFVARGVLRRCTNPHLPDNERRAEIKTLMQARLAMRTASDPIEAEHARSRINEAKIALGEAGPVWWSDGAPDLSGHHPTDTSYRDWWLSLPEEDRHAAEEDRRANLLPR